MLPVVETIFGDKKTILRNRGHKTAAFIVSGYNGEAVVVEMGH